MAVGAALVLAALAAAGWVAGAGSGEPLGTAVLGLYRDRVFAANVALTWAALVASWVAWLRPGTPALLRAIALHLGVALPVLLAEAAAFGGLVDFRARLVPGAPQSRPADPRLRRMGEPNTHVRGRVAPDLVQILGVEAAEVPFDFRTDRYGLRNLGDKSDPAVFCLGDSVLVAALVPAAETLTEQLERGLGLPVLNVSESGYSPQEAALRLELLGLPLRGRLVLQFVFDGNDLADSSAWRAWIARRAAVDWPNVGLLKSLLGSLHRARPGAAAARLGLFRGTSGEESVWFLWDRSTQAAHLDEIPAVLDALAGIRARVEGERGRYAVVLVPSKLRALHEFTSFPEGSEIATPEERESALASALLAWAERERVSIFDLTPALRGEARSGRLPYFPADTHLNAHGHTVAAGALLPWTRALLAELGR